MIPLQTRSMQCKIDDNTLIENISIIVTFCLDSVYKTLNIIVKGIVTSSKNNVQTVFWYVRVDILH